MTKQNGVENQKEFERFVLISPGGHKYEVSVTDSGNLMVKYKKDDLDSDE
ncbi:hypothetical protein [Ammoniphilus sp. YIM 78166]|nr:hypothetical protein [Ammoniphilus sp. YIM 78166]